MKIGEKIRELRLRSGVKAIDLARHLGVNRSYISQIEHNVCKPTPEQLKKIASYLDYDSNVFEDIEYDFNLSMHRLFKIYEKYGGIIETDDSIKEQVKNGSLKEGVYISFENINAFMAEWYFKVKEMEDGDITKEQLQEWMDRYTVEDSSLPSMSKAQRAFDELMNNKKEE